jgi:hypothetical protein
MPTALVVVGHAPGAHGSPAQVSQCAFSHARSAPTRLGGRRLLRRCRRAARLACSLDSSGAQPSGVTPPPARGLWTSSPPFLQRLASVSTPVDVFQACSEAAPSRGAEERGAAVELQAEDCAAVLEALVQLRRVPLAMATYQVRMT